jgi:hypothetical protein
MADLDPEDFMSEAEEDMAGANPDDPADGEAEEKVLRTKKSISPRTSMGTGRNPMLRILTSKPWKARAL